MSESILRPAATVTSPSGLAVELVLVMASLLVLLLRGFVCSRLWLWFAVPLGLPVVSTGAFAGLVLMLGLIRGMKYEESTPIEKRWMFLGAYVFASLLSWFFGWLIAGQP